MTEADKDESEEDGRGNPTECCQLSSVQGSMAPHPASLQLAECALQTGHIMSLLPSTQLCDLLSRGKIFDLSSIAYFTEIMRSMLHSIAKCTSAAASLVNLISELQIREKDV